MTVGARLIQLPAISLVNVRLNVMIIGAMITAKDVVMDKNQMGQRRPYVIISALRGAMTVLNAGRCMIHVKNSAQYVRIKPFAMHIVLNVMNLVNIVIIAA